MQNLPQRKHTRVNVNLSVSCQFTDDKIQKNIYSLGRVFDISSGGMKVCLPINSDPNQGDKFQYLINLPRPFSRLAGNGKIRWMQTDESRQQLFLGMTFTGLSASQMQDLESIIEELSEEDLEPIRNYN
ncbi:PilZ domain-containing protein [bacterium]|nr:PilZ domain-containing protein [bacterium]